MNEELLDLASEWAPLLLASFVEAGVTDLIISPGSRSTPFVLAAVRDGRLTIHDCVDERSAAFFALGQAKRRAAPSLLLCTSGTAAAHYAPAIIEANQSYTPLLVLTADRPLELQACAAAQTIDQLKLYGNQVRAFFELGAADSTPLAWQALKRIAAQATSISRYPTPGPVHLNVRARRPFEPMLVQDRDERATVVKLRSMARSPATCVYPPTHSPDPAGVERIACACREARHGLIVCGPAPLTQVSGRESIHTLSRLTGYPIWAEATSQLRFWKPDSTDVLPPPCDAFAALLTSEAFRLGEAPELVIQLGAPPTTTAWETYLSMHPSIRRQVIAPYGWNDPQSSAELLLMSDVGLASVAVCRKLAECGRRERPSPWAVRLAELNQQAWAAINRCLEHQEQLSEAEVVRTVLRALSRDAVLAIGNSLPIRLLDLYCPAQTGQVAVWSQRGANGIDGLISGAAGVASTGQPTALLIGDISFIHDIGGLAMAKTLTAPFPLVVLNNHGGRIFEELPVATDPDLTGAVHHFTTPHDYSFAAAAALFGIPYHPVKTTLDLEMALRKALSTGGASLIDAVVPPQGAASMMREVAEGIDARCRLLFGETT